jgi:hypothetical protein
MIELNLTERLGHRVELINGVYNLGEIATRQVGAREIVYAVGQACLDNSCCGGLDLSYALVYGERVGSADGEEGAWRIRTLDEPALMELVRNELVRCWGVATVNFYSAPH